MTLGITGVTGNLGRNLLNQLSDVISANPTAYTLIARSPEKIKETYGANVRKASYEDSVESVEALKGIDVLFMVSGKENAHRLEQHKAFIDAAHKAGVKHIVYTSFYSAAPDATFTLARDHYHTEEHVKSYGMKYTFIRDNFYMDFFVDLVKEYGEIKGPAGNGKVSAMVRSDVAKVLATILRNPMDHENKVYDMTGPEDLTMQDICDTINTLKGTHAKYIEETVEQAYESRKAWPAQQWEYDSWVSTYTAIQKGEQEGVSSDIESIIGCKPTSLKEYIQNNFE